MPLLLLGLRQDLSGKRYPAANIYSDGVVPQGKKGFIMEMMMEY